ncbi:MAG TPA: hypothetical protein VH740_03865 [Vicinamibacterales bacterium]|jgi:hypothetical protein
MSASRSSLSAALIRLYPREWRVRYGDEMAHVLAEQPTTMRLVFDLLAGAIDAWMYPQSSAGAAGATASKGETAVTKLLTYCQPHEITSAEYNRSVVWMLGTTVVLSGIFLALRRALGDNILVDAFGVSTFPVAVLVSSWATYFKRYSKTARVAIIAGLGAIVFFLSLGAESLGRAF